MERPVQHYDGYATMYMRMPISTSSLPIQGQCFVDDRRITLRFPFTGIEFELPSLPSDVVSARLQQQQQHQQHRKTNGAIEKSTTREAADFDFKIRGARGDMLISIRYVPELNAFTGEGHQDDDVDQPVLTFCFYPPDSLLSRLPKI